MAQSQAYWQPAIYRVAASFLLVAALAGPLHAQIERSPATLVDPALQGDDRFGGDQPYSGPDRYEEPPPPPFDGVVPTWLPCQSLRYNRSLVLGHLYVGMDIMGWATKGVHTPPLVTTSPLGTPAAQAGVLGQSDTTVLFGGEFFHNEMRPGGRLRIGWWFDTDQTSGIEWHYFELDGQNIRFNSTVEENEGILARPFIDADTGLESSVLVAFPGLSGGTIRALSDFQLTSTGIVFHDLLWASPFARIDYIVGYRHAHLFDSVRIEQTNSPAAATIKRVDKFRAVNQFDGGDIGLRGWWSNNGKLAVTSVAKVALGAANNNVIVNGYSTSRTGNNTTTTGQGTLALLSNEGGHPHQEFGIVSEIGIGLEWRPICQWKLDLGWTWLYWSQVARAASHIDRTLDFDQITSGTPDNRPAFHLQTTSFWAQGINAAFTYDF